MNAEGRVTVVVGEDTNGPAVAIEFPDVTMVVDPKMVTYHEGRLTVQVPATIDLPLDAVVIDRWLPPEVEQVYLAVNAIPSAYVERLLIQEQMTNMGEAMGELAKRAVARAVLGETGAD